MTRANLPKPIKSEDPVVILRHVIKAIQEEPKRYDQGIYNTTIDDFENPDATYLPACGTVCCVAGWVCVLKGKRAKFYGDEHDIAMRALGLDDGEAGKLFSGSAVPMRARMGARRHAAAGIKHIKRFVLKKWGKKL